MFSHRTCIRITGTIWILAGVLLFGKGLKFLFGEFSSLQALPLAGKAALLFVLGVLTGYCKGRFVLRRTAERVSARILALPQPIPLKNLYPFSYWVLIACMMGIAALLNLIGVSANIRGAIDVAIGAALLKGSWYYFSSCGRAIPLKSR